jgi:hypothetical protein
MAGVYFEPLPHKNKSGLKINTKGSLYQWLYVVEEKLLIDG